MIPPGKAEAFLRLTNPRPGHIRVLFTFLGFGSEWHMLRGFAHMEVYMRMFPYFYVDGRANFN